MKINLAIIFVGRSVEHEISVLSAQQCIAAINKDKYTIIPIYISKQGQWYTGDKLLDLKQYCDIEKLLTQSIQIAVNQNAGACHICREIVGLFGKKHILRIILAKAPRWNNWTMEGTLLAVIRVSLKSSNPKYV